MTQNNKQRKMIINLWLADFGASDEATVADDGTVTFTATGATLPHAEMVSGDYGTARALLSGFLAEQRKATYIP